MTFFAVQYSYVDDASALDGLRPAHREYLSSLPQLVAAGPFVDSAPGALLVLHGDSAEEISTALDGDPFWVANLITERSIEQWKPVLGVFADQQERS